MRVTIVLNDELSKLLRVKQATVIKNTGANYSFSSVVNDYLRKGLLK